MMSNGTGHLKKKKKNQSSSPVLRKKSDFQLSKDWEKEIMILLGNLTRVPKTPQLFNTVNVSARL